MQSRNCVVQPGNGVQTTDFHVHFVVKLRRRFVFSTLPLCLFLLGFFPVATQCLAQGGPPVITSQPQSQIVGLGNSATFTVTVSTSTFPTYDWRLEGLVLFHTAGGTNSSYTLTNVQFIDAGNYSVV